MEAMRTRTVAMTVSFCVGFLILIIKCTAFALTGSAAILGDAMESVMHVLITGLVFWFSRISVRPPDEDHPYGHGRIEFLSVGFEGGLLFLTGIGVVGYAAFAWWRGSEPHRLDFGIAISLAAGLINLFLGLYLLRAGRRADSPLLYADGQHVLADVWTSAGVAVGLGSTLLFPDDWAAAVAHVDVGIAVLVGVLIILEGTKLLRRAVAGLMDEADEPTLERIVAAINRVREPDWTQLHALRCRHQGNAYHVDFHLVVPPDWTVERGHATSDTLEAAILEELEAEGSVLVHLDCRPDPADSPQERDFTLEEALRRDLPSRIKEA